MITARGRAGLAALGLAGLAACGGRIDTDMRSLGEGFSTTEAAMGAMDGSGAVAPVAPVGAAPVATAAFVPVAGAPLPTGAPVTTTSLAPVAAAPLAPLAPATPAAGATRHTVVRGETAYSIARLYGVPVGTLAQANGLGADLGIREGQELVVPAAAGAGAIPVTQPGQGSPTPVPPSASAPLPEEEVEPVSATPDPAPVPQEMAAQQTVTASNAALAMPVTGSIIRDYAPGRNEGIDIGASAGTEVRAADAGTVAAVTTNTEGVQIVVIRHAGDLLTVYTHLDVTVSKDQSVARGQAIGRVRAGDPSFLHFEVRRGMESQDPNDFLP